MFSKAVKNFLFSWAMLGLLILAVQFFRAAPVANMLQFTGWWEENLKACFAFGLAPLLGFFDGVRSIITQRARSSINPRYLGPNEMGIHKTLWESKELYGDEAKRLGIVRAAFYGILLVIFLLPTIVVGMYAPNLVSREISLRVTDILQNIHPNN